MFCYKCKFFKKYKSKNFIGRCKYHGYQIIDNITGCNDHVAE